MNNSAKTGPVFMLDNYDSFTYNLVHYLEQLEVEVVVKRNDQVTLQEIQSLDPSHIVISPGPCDPDKAGMSIEIVNHFQGQAPILGVCLGHQTIGQVFGGKVVQASQVVHGKVSPIYHNSRGIFHGLPSPYQATRYHSLVIDKASLPDCLEITAWTENSQGELQYIMGIKHKNLPIEGIQFHPESVLSDHGLELLQNFIASHRLAAKD